MHTPAFKAARQPQQRPIEGSHGLEPLEAEMARMLMQEAADAREATGEEAKLDEGEANADCFML